MSKPVRVGIYSSLVVCLIAVGAIWFISIASRSNASTANEVGSPAQEQFSAVRVETVKVTREDLKRVTEPGPAELLPFEQTDLYAKASGFLKEVKVDIGDRLKKGDVVAELYIPELVQEFEQKKQFLEQAKAAVVQAHAAVDAAEAEVDAAAARVALTEAAKLKAEADFQYRQKDHQRIKNLAETTSINQAVVDEKQFQMQSADAARAEAAAKIKSASADISVQKAKLAKAKSDVIGAEAGVGVAQADANRVAALLEYATIRAPYDSVITQRNVHTGAYIDSKADGTPLFRIVRSDVLRVVVDIPEKDVPYLNVGDQVQTELDALPGTNFKWPIARFAPVLGTGRKVRAEIHIKNEDGKLYPGMYGRASIVLEDKPGTLTVPAAALANDSTGTFVYCVADGKAKRLPVTIGLNDGRKVEITSGLNGNEEIITAGRASIRDGQPVVVVKNNAPSKT